MFLCQQAANQPVNSRPIGLIVILHVINIPVKSLAMLIAADSIKVCWNWIHVRLNKA
jgi:hypothetical protein